VGRAAAAKCLHVLPPSTIIIGLCPLMIVPVALFEETYIYENIQVYVLKFM